MLQELLNMEILTTKLYVLILFFSFFSFSFLFFCFVFLSFVFSFFVFCFSFCFVLFFFPNEQARVDYVFCCFCFFCLVSFFLLLLFLFFVFLFRSFLFSFLFFRFFISSFSVFFCSIFWFFKKVVKLCDGCNGADLRNICTEAGMFAIDKERSYVIQEGLKLFLFSHSCCWFFSFCFSYLFFFLSKVPSLVFLSFSLCVKEQLSFSFFLFLLFNFLLEDFMKAVRKVAESKKLEGNLAYNKV